jgi:putative membrane protein
LQEDGRKQILSPKSNDGWLRTLFVLEGRALDRIILPWSLVTLNAIVWTVIVQCEILEEKYTTLANDETYFGLVLNSSLAFLLVFRLNRSAERYWIARASWGSMVGVARAMVGGILVHGRHDPTNRDAVVKWIASFFVVGMHYIRGEANIIPDTVAGILNESEIEEMEGVHHLGLHAAYQIRCHLKEIFRIDEDTLIGIAVGRSQQLDTLEKQLNDLILQFGVLERIRATPLPLVYVTHLRTFLLLFLLALPYTWEMTLGYATIPIVSLTAFALLGLEGAAEEVESPFLKSRPNHLSMDAYCLVIIENILQQIRQDADRDIRQKAEEKRKSAATTQRGGFTKSEESNVGTYSA